jgi:hypothetical protein
MGSRTLWSGGLPPVRWSAVFAGAVIAVGVHVLLGLFGTALGLAAEPADSGGLGGFAALWSLLTPFAASLVGAWIAVRLAASPHVTGAHLHGLLVWALGVIAGAMFLTGPGSALARGTADLRTDAIAHERAASRGAAAAALAGLGALLGLAGTITGALMGRRALLGGQVFSAAQPKSRERVAAGRVSEVAAAPTRRQRAGVPTRPGVDVVRFKPSDPEHQQ